MAGIPCSTITDRLECFLKKLRKDGYIRYTEGSEFFDTAEDETNPPEGLPPLKPLDAKTKARLEKVKDLVLFRYGSTGVKDAISRAVESRGLIPVYPVKSIHNFTCDGYICTTYVNDIVNRTKGVFRDCLLIFPKTTVREFCGMLSSEMEKHFLYAEGANGQRVNT